MRKTTWFAAFWFACMAATAVGQSAAEDGSPPFRITTKRDNDRVAVTLEKEQVSFAIRSPFGISQAVIERTRGAWPKTVVLQLHLKGLENFKVTSGKLTLEGAASLEDGKRVVRLWQAGKEEMPLDAKSPHWIDVRILNANGEAAKAIPLKDGYFELTLPKVFLDGNPSVTVDWIDFYRN